MKIIAFGHRRFVGKDTAVKLLTTHLRMTKPGICIRKMSFADKVKDISYQLYSWAGLKDSYYYKDHVKEKDEVLPDIGMTPREIWIKLGTNAIRNQVYNNTWVDYLLRNVSNCDYIFIQDLRFPNEANAILQRNGLMFRIDRTLTSSDSKYTEIVNIADDPLKDYQGWTDIIDNNGTLKDFNTKILQLAEKWL